MTEREFRRSKRAQRGRDRAKAGREPSRAQLDQGAHLADCDRQHERPPVGRCNLNRRSQAARSDA